MQAEDPVYAQLFVDCTEPLSERVRQRPSFATIVERIERDFAIRR